jgi:hypothetical protein
MPALPGYSQGSNGQKTASRLPRLARPALAVVALLFLMADDGISRDEFLCEAAVVHMADCCPDFPSGSLYCVRSGCDGKVSPDIDEERAQCLRGKSCAELRALGACDMSRWEPVPSCVTPCSPKVPSCS